MTDLVTNMAARTIEHCLNSDHEKAVRFLTDNEYRLTDCDVEDLLLTFKDFAKEEELNNTVTLSIDSPKGWALCVESEEGPDLHYINNNDQYFVEEL